MVLRPPLATEEGVVEFGDCRLDTAARELRRRGQLVHLQPKVFDVLSYLVQQRDRVVTKDELLAQLWPDEVVGETSLTFAVKSVRRAIGDDGASQAMLRTIHGRGYRFVAPLARKASAAAIGGGPEPDSAAPGVPARERIMLQPSAAPFVGRTAERQALDLELARVLEGQTRTVFVLGDPGVGKSRLVAEFASAAERAGIDVLVGRCSEDSPPAFWPWIQAIRAWTRQHGLETARRVAGDGAADIARALPGLLGEEQAVPSGQVGEGAAAHERLRLFDSLVAFLREASRIRPLAVVLDDLHWADASSLLVLRHLMREVLDARILVVGTYRHVEVEPGGPLAQLLAWLHRTKRSTRLRLHGLDDDELAVLVRSLVPVDAGAELVVALGRASDGNPFFVEEFCRDVAERGWGGGTEVALHVPEQVRDVLLRRVARLGDGVHDVLVAAAVLGREFRYEDLVEVAGAGREGVLASLEAAETGGLVHAEAASPGSFAFAHALVTDVLRDSVPGIRRAELHRRAGLALEAGTGRDPLERSTMLAHHFFAAASVGEGPRALRHAVEAGRLHAERFAYEDAALHYDRAVQLARAGACDESERFEILLALARASSRAGDEERVRDLVLEAVEIARRLGSVERLARAALRSATLFPVTPADRVALLEEALRALRGRDDVDRRLLARVLSALAAALYTTPGEVDRREQLVDEAMRLARACGDPRTLVHALRASHVALWQPRHLARRIELAREHVAVAEASRDPVEMATARTWYVPALVEGGQIAEADRHIDGIEAEAAATRMLVYRANALSFRAMRALADARLDEAEFLARRAYELARRSNETTASMTLWSQVYYVRREQGRLGEIEAGIHMFAAQVPQVSWDWLVVHLLAEDGRLAEARQGLDAMMARGLREALPPDAHIVSSSATFGIAEVAWRLRDPAAAAVVLPLLEELGERWVTVGLGGVCLGAASYAAGLALAASGRFDEAVAALARAEAAHEAAGVLVPLLRTRAELGAVLLASRDRRSRRRAVDLLDSTRIAADAAGLVQVQNLVAAAGA